MAQGRIKRWWLGFIQRRLNPTTLAAARSGRGPFSLVRHRGRKSGRIYEAPLVLAQVPEGIIAELTYGPEVNWYRNVVAGGGEVLHRGQWYRVTAVEPFPADRGRRAFGPFRSLILTLLRRHDFRLLKVEAIDPPTLPGVAGKRGSALTSRERRSLSG